MVMQVTLSLKVHFHEISDFFFSSKASTWYLASYPKFVSNTKSSSPKIFEDNKISVHPLIMKQRRHISILFYKHNGQYRNHELGQLKDFLSQYAVRNTRLDI